MIKNPILSGFNPDPSIIRVGDIYYIANSTFEWFPAISIYKSYNLSDWQLCNHALKRESQVDLKGLDSAMGVWAPSLTYNKKLGKFYIAYSVVYGCKNNNFDVDNFYVETLDIEGEWSEPYYLNSSGFDPSLFIDFDYKAYLVNLEWDQREGYEHPGAIVLQEYSLEKRMLLGEAKRISRGATDRGCLEGPNIYRKNDYYYLVTAEGGTGFGHCVAVSRSKNIFGPYESCPYNPIITSCPENFSERGNPDSAKAWRYFEGSILQKSGHGSIVETQNDEVYIAHLTSRPFVPELRSTLGRESALQKCEWTSDGWIKMVGNTNMAQIEVAEPKNLENKLEKMDRKHSCGLPIDFYTLRENFSEKWLKVSEKSFKIKGGNTLFSLYNQSVVAQKVTSFSYTGYAKIKFVPNNFLQSAGIVNYYNSSAFYYLRIYYSESLGGIALGIMKSDKEGKKEIKKSRVLIEKENMPIYLKCVVKDRDLQYFYSFDGDNYQKIGEKQDVTILSDEYVTGFTGSVFGVTAQDLYTKDKWCEVYEFELENN